MKKGIDWLMVHNVLGSWQKLWGMPFESNPQIALDDELKKLASGKLLINTPHEMQVGVPERVNVRIAKTATQNFLEGLVHSQEAEVENIRTSRSMIVSLRSEDFKIEALSNEEQIIEDTDYTQWDYKVAPLKSGNRKVCISITVLLTEENEDFRKTLLILEKEITVRSNPIYSIKTFVSDYWQWIFASALIPAIGLVLKVLRGT